MKINYNSEGLTFESQDIQEALLKSECFHAENVHEHLLAWHQMIVKQKSIPHLEVMDKLRLWGMDPDDGMAKAQNVLHSRQKQYEWDMTPIEDIKYTPQYERGLQLVTQQFGGPLQDGSILFSYQIETAAMMIAKKRLLLGLDMGLGSVLCSVMN